MLYPAIVAIFSVTVTIANLISVKMVRLPIFEDFSIPAGILVYPLSFLLSDLATELFGARKAKEMVFMAMGTSLLAYALIQTMLLLPAKDAENQAIFQAAFGLSGLVVFASLVAYVMGQILDIQLYALIKRWTGEHWLWLRNNGSTLAAQIVDTLLVNTIHLYWGLGMEMEQVIPIMLFSYGYKAFFTVFNTPLFYLFVSFGKRRVALAV